MKKSMLLFSMVMCLCTCLHAQYKTDDKNTIAYKDPRGIAYKLISVGDKLPQLFVDGKEIPSGQFDAYKTIIEKLQTELWERQKKLSLADDKEYETQLNRIAGDLVSQKIISSSNALNSFRLDKNGFLVNGQKQSYAVFARYRDKFIISSSTIYQFNN